MSDLKILGNVRLTTNYMAMEVVAVETAKGTFTAYLSPSHSVTHPDKSNKAQVAKFERQQHQHLVAMSNRGIILEKDVAMAFFPKLKKRKYLKKVLNPELQ